MGELGGRSPVRKEVPSFVKNVPVNLGVRVVRKEVQSRRIVHPAPPQVFSNPASIARDAHQPMLLLP